MTADLPARRFTALLTEATALLALFLRGLDSISTSIVRRQVECLSFASYDSDVQSLLDQVAHQSQTGRDTCNQADLSYGGTDRTQQKHLEHAVPVSIENSYAIYRTFCKKFTTLISNNCFYYR